MPKSSYESTFTRTFQGREQASFGLQGDALSQPSVDDLISGGLSFWPAGAAWGSPDGEAVSLDGAIARFTKVLLAPFAFLYARAWQLVGESSAQTVNETLDEWESDYGLPERCFTGSQTTAQRLIALRRKVSSELVSHPEDFIRLAADYGFTITIEEPCLFECGFSECGGRHAVGSYIDETYWIVRVKDAAVSYFEVSVSECGYDPLFDLGAAEQILCLLRQLAPAWTTPVLAPWIKVARLVTEDGGRLIDEYQNPICVTY